MFDDLVQIWRQRSNVPQSSRRWTGQELLDFMESHLVRSHGTSFFQFIDDIDECGEKDARENATYFRRITLISAANGCSVNVLDRENEDDISVFVKARLVEYRAVTPQRKEHYRSSIISKARGNFLWAALAVAFVNTCNGHGTPDDKIEKKLRQSPGELDVRYAQLFGEKSPEELQDSLRFWRAFTLPVRTLGLSELWHLYVFLDTARPESLELASKLAGRTRKVGWNF
ncbi:uncharacterized protein PV07_00195 [Cladophialophora immunda]|uniref:Uncharacterized protein n=1 Tax=Cladophialophora immunda TaxID=569365 RepID=A0A0D2CQ25_9EURO|nr:uncharacterized protein PV07_00195 [Cladophialophora immunda]KIW33338.1 hypothetical protein PV07_00195 [Cladophialophora immunda]